MKPSEDVTGPRKVLSAAMTRFHSPFDRHGRSSFEKHRLAQESNATTRSAREMALRLCVAMRQHEPDAAASQNTSSTFSVDDAVLVRRRLVGKNQTRPRKQGPCHRSSLLFTKRSGAWDVFAEVCKPKSPEDLFSLMPVVSKVCGTFAPMLLCPQPPRQRHILNQGQIFQESRRLRND